jgi:hypothetical protein
MWRPGTIATAMNFASAGGNSEFIVTGAIQQAAGT